MTPPKDQRGAALLIVLALVASVAAIALAVTRTGERATARALAASFREEATFALLGAEKAALLLLEAQAAERAGVDTPDERWLAAPFTLPLDRGTLTIRMRDASVCYNVNDLVNGLSAEQSVADEQAIDRFGLFIVELGGSQAAGEALAAVIADFIDGDDRATLNGAEDFTTLSGPVPFRTAGRPMVDLSTVRALPGWTARLYRALAPYLCAYPNTEALGPMNVNSLRDGDGVLVSAALDWQISPQNAERLIERRPPEGYDSLAAFFSAPEFSSAGFSPGPATTAAFSTEAAYIEFYGVVAYDGVEFEMTSMIENSQTSGYRVFWRRLAGPGP